MYDVHVRLAARPGELARLGKVLGAAGVSSEGGGVFTVPDGGHAHFLVEDGELAATAIRAAGLDLLAVSEVLVRRLNQVKPGQLGAVAAALAEAGVDIETMYSDHANQLILVVDDLAKAAAATRGWAP